MKRKLKATLTTIMASMMVGIIVYLIFFKGEDKLVVVEEAKVIEEIKDYGYELKDNETELYNDLFAELITALNEEEINEVIYAEVIGKLFLINFYTLDNKVTKNDVGGVQFVYSDFVGDFEESAKTTMYKYVESNIYGDRDQDLPIVKTIDLISIEQEPFEYLETTDELAYTLSFEWTYKEDLGYETESELIIVHEEDKLSIVEMD